LESSLIGGKCRVRTAKVGWWSGSSCLFTECGFGIGVLIGVSTSALRGRHCFAKMRTKVVSIGVWANCADAIASISSRCVSNSARHIPLPAPQATSQVTKRGIADLALHNLRAIPHRELEHHQIGIIANAVTRVSGINPAPFQQPADADHRARQRKKMDSGLHVNDFDDNRFTEFVGHHPGRSVRVVSGHSRTCPPPDAKDRGYHGGLPRHAPAAQRG
jgi:hypothetical protein